MKKIYAISNQSGKLEWGFWDLYKYQKEALELINNNNHSVISSSRQVGVTTIMANYIAEMMMTCENKRFMVISNNVNCANRIISLIKARIENDPIPFYFNKKNVNEISLVNGSSVTSAAATASAGHSYEFDHIFIDNAAFIDNLEKVYKSISVRAKKITMTSCQKYDDSFFNKCIKDKKSWTHLKVHWMSHPEFVKGLHTGGINGHGSLWYDRMCRSLGNDPDAIKSELDCIPVPRKKKEKIKEPKDTKITVRIDEGSMSKVGKKLIEKDVTISQYIRELINKDVK